MIFNEKLVIGESGDFSWDFYIYIGRKWFEFVVGSWVVWWVKVLILVGFDDIGGDIGIFGVGGWKVGILLVFVGFWFRGLIFKLVCG